jgi:hypothetical protein
VLRGFGSIAGWYPNLTGPLLDKPSRSLSFKVNLLLSLKITNRAKAKFVTVGHVIVTDMKGMWCVEEILVSNNSAKIGSLRLALDSIYNALWQRGKRYFKARLSLRANDTLTRSLIGQEVS